MVTRTRLPRGKSSKPNGRLRTQITSELKALSTARIKKYAVLSDATVASSPILSLTRDQAKKEIQNRAQLMGEWKEGNLTKKEVAKKALEFAQKGAVEFGKVITGVKAQELEETIATAGMKPEEKKIAIAKIRKERAKSIEMFPAEEPLSPEDFSLGGSELKKLKEEALG